MIATNLYRPSSWIPAPRPAPLAARPLFYPAPAYQPPLAAYLALERGWSQFVSPWPGGTPHPWANGVGNPLPHPWLAGGGNPPPVNWVNGAGLPL